MAHGAYLAAAAGCDECHTDSKHGGRPYAGGRAIETRFGTLVTPNITPDPNTGIGRWRPADFTRAMRWGVAPDTSHYLPAFPFPYYNRLSVRDLEDLKAFLDSLQAGIPAQPSRRPRSVCRRARCGRRSRLEIFWTLASRSDEGRAMESGRLPRCYGRPLRRLPHATQLAWGSRSRSPLWPALCRPRWPCRSEHHPGPGNRDRAVERRRYRHLADRRSKAGLRFCRRRHGRNREEHRPPQRRRPASDRRLPQIAAADRLAKQRLSGGAFRHWTLGRDFL